MRDDTTGGMMVIVGGVSVLLMMAVGIGALLEMRERTGKEDLQEEVAEQGQVRENLREEIVRARKQLQLVESRGADRAAAEELAAWKARLRRRQEQIWEQKEDLTRELQEREAGFADYRTRQKTAVRQQVLGTKWSVLALRSGRELREVTISEVGDRDMLVRHESGVTRVRFEDLSPSWQQKMRWEGTEEEALPVREHSPVEPPVELPQAGGEGKERQAILAKPEQAGWEEIETARNQFRVARAARDAAVAATNDARARIGGRQRSPFGSLETWEQRAERLNRQALQCEVSLETARRNLRRLSPYDPLLKTR